MDRRGNRQIKQNVSLGVDFKTTAYLITYTKLRELYMLLFYDKIDFFMTTTTRQFRNPSFETCREQGNSFIKIKINRATCKTFSHAAKLVITPAAVGYELK